MDKLKLDASAGKEPKVRKPFLLRIDPKLLDDLEHWAQDELRSVNGQIERIVRQAVQKRRGSPLESPLRSKRGPRCANNPFRR